MLHFKRWYLWVLLMGSLWELIGFITRIISIHQPTTLSYYAASMTLIIVAPVWIVAFYYMTLGRIILTFLPKNRVFGISSRFLTMIFLLGDVISFIVQLVASGILNNEDGTQEQFDLGRYIFVGGVTFQFTVFMGFVGLCWRFEVDYRRDVVGQVGEESWRGLMKVMYVGCACVVVRSVFRIAEFAQEYPGPLVVHEAPFYVMDAVPMAIATAVFVWWHPGTVLVGPESSFREARRERKRVKDVTKRGLTEEEGSESDGVEMV